MGAFKTTPFDWYNFMAQNVNSNSLIQYVLRLDQGVNYSHIVKALNLCFMAEPTLSCVFNVVDSAEPQWIEVDCCAGDVCKEIETSDTEHEVYSFLAERIDASAEIPIKIAYIHNSANNEYLIAIKIHHALCDGMASVQAVKLIASMYTEFEADSSFEPLAKPLKRSTDDLYSYFEVLNKADRFNEKLLPNMQSTWGIPVAEKSCSDQFSFQLLQLESSQIELMTSYANRNNSSLNALITATYHRALVNLLNPSDTVKEVQFTVNLRKYSTNSQNYSLCNLSNTLNVELPTRISFEELVGVAKESIDSVIEPEKMLQSVLACELMSTSFQTLNGCYLDEWRIIEKTGLSSPMISNLGQFSKELVRFGKATATGMYLVPPAFCAPAIMLSVGTYNNVMSLCVAYQSPSTAHGFVKDLLSNICSIVNNLR